MEQVTSITVEETDDGELIIELQERSAHGMKSNVQSRRIVEPPFSIDLKADHEVLKEDRKHFTVEGEIFADVREYDE